MIFKRDKGIGGAPVSEEYAMGMQAMERWYSKQMQWTAAYIYLLEKRIQELEAREEQGSNRNDQENGTSSSLPHDL